MRRNIQNIFYIFVLLLSTVSTGITQILRDGYELKHGFEIVSSAKTHHDQSDYPVYAVNQADHTTSAIAVKQYIDSNSYHSLRGNLSNSRIRFERFKKGRVAFLGGSITYNPGWRDMICDYLKERFPDTEFEFIAAGIPSMGSTPGAFRLERDVLIKGTVDLLFEEAAVNDRYNGRSAQEQIRAMEGIVRHARESNPAMDIVFMYFVDPLKMEDYNNGHIPPVIQNHEAVADYYGIPAINLAKEVNDRILAGEFTWKDDFKNLHPSPFGQKIYFQSMKTFLENTWHGNISEDDTIVNHSLPAKLDHGCYDKGKFVSIREAKLNNGWKLVERWVPGDDAGTRDGYVDVPMLIVGSPGAELELSFEGNAVGISVAAGPDAGKIEFSIDNNYYREIDLFTQWSAGLHLPWFHVLDAGLEPGKHVLRIKISSAKNPESKGHTCRIAHFFVNGN